MFNVLIDRGNAPPKTGIGIYGELLLHAMQTFQSHDVNISEAGISFPSRSLRPLRRLLYLLKLAQLRSERFRGANVVHFINQYVPERLENVSYVVSIHDLDPIMVPEVHTKRFSYYFKKSIQLAVNRAHLIISQSEAVRSEILDYYQLSPESVCVGGDGLSQEFIELANKTPKVNQDMPVLLYVGQLSKKKNIAWLINTVQKGVTSGALPPLRLVLAGGKGYGFREIEPELLQSKELVCWHDSPTLEMIVSLYCNCSAVILPSLREGFGRPLLEAMYCDKPIIASHIPTSREIAGNGASYFAIGDEDEFFDAVHEALLDRKSISRRKIASEMLRKYSWEHLAQVYLEIYKKAAWLC
jgi:glycosyltransferase involved in cell wall biosynthesis